MPKTAQYIVTWSQEQERYLLLGGLVYTEWGHFQTYAAGALIIALAIASVVIAIPSLRKSHQEPATSNIR